MPTEFYIALALFAGAYLLISTERVHRTKVALTAAVLMILTGVIGQREAIASIDFNTIFLLMGMMILVNVTRESGVFEFLAIRGVRAARGRPWRILVMFSILTAIISAFLDNVTTVLLFTPIVLFIADMLETKPFPFLVAIIFSANIGGTATLIGAPPNIMIGSAAGFSFIDFLIHIFPITVVIFAANLGLLWLVFRKKMSARRAEEALKLDASRAIKNRSLMYRSLSVLALTIVGFVLHGFLNLQPATVALSGAALVLLLVPGNPVDYLEKIEWNTLFFFGGLFVLVGGLESAGIIEAVFQWLSGFTSDVGILSVVILFAAAYACSFVDNIPFTAAMIPLVTRISQHLFPGLAGHAVFEATMPLWWALSLGANLGGNGTIIAASPNVVVSGIAESDKHKIGFGRFIRYGMLSVTVSVAIAAVYIWLRYLL